MPITFFGSLVDHIEEKSECPRLSKTTDLIKVTVSDTELQIDKENLLDSTHKKICGNIVILELDLLNEKLLSSNYKAAVMPEDEDDFIICVAIQCQQLKVASEVVLLNSWY